MADINFEVSGFKTFRQELKEAQIEMQKVISQFGETSVQAQNAARNVAEIKDKIDDANDAVSSFTGAGKFQAVGKAVQATAGAFTAAQGAAALFGAESEDLQKTMAKLQGALALTQGLAALEDAGRAFKQLGTLAVGAFNSIKAAFGSTGVGAVIIGVTALLSALIFKFGEAAEEAEKIKTAEEAYKKYNDTLADTNALMEARLNYLKATGTDEKTILEETIKVRKEAEAENERLLQKLARDRTAYDSEERLANESKDKGRIERAKANTKALDEQAAKARANIVTLATATKIAEKDLTNFTQSEVDKRNKTVDDGRKKREAEAKAELDALNSLNEARRKKIEAQTTDEKQLAKVKFDNDLERLQEAKSKELAQENLTAKAIYDINEKYKVLGETLQIQYDQTILSLTQKGNKEIEDEEKRHAEEVKAIQEKKFAALQARTNRAFTQAQIDLDNSTLQGREYREQQEQDELDNLNRQRRDLVQAGKDTVEIDGKIAAQRRLIATNAEEDRKAREQALADFTIQSTTALLDSLKQLQDAKMSAELAAVGDNQEKQEKIREEYFEKDKNFQYAKASMAAIQGGIQAFTQGMEIGGPALAALFLAFSLASTSVQLAAISKTQYVAPSAARPEAKATPSTYAEGGLLQGPSHDLGGIRTALGELEGGEFVINKQSTASFLPLLQQINNLGNQGNPQMVATTQSSPIVKAYVLAGDVTSAQEANARLNSLAKL